MESKQEIALEIFDIVGRIETFNKTFESIQCKLDEWSNQQNATLIEQNRKLISDINLAIVMLESPLTSHKSVIERLQQTLTDTENGK